MKKASPKLWAVIPAAGTGRRFSTHELKQYQRINAKTVLEHTVNALYQLPLSGCVIAIHAEDQHAAQIDFKHPVDFCIGGQERVDSVLAGLVCLDDRAQPEDYIVVHDAARPCLHQAQIQHILEFCQTDQIAAIVATPVRDTLKKSDTHQKIVTTVDRTALWQAQTPQIVKYSVLFQALQHVTQQQLKVTDEASALEYLNIPVQLLQGRSDNIKITYPEDLELARLILQD